MHEFPQISIFFRSILSFSVLWPGVKYILLARLDPWTFFSPFRHTLLIPFFELMAAHSVLVSWPVQHTLRSIFSILSSCCFSHSLLFCPTRCFYVYAHGYKFHARV